jgi:ketosteroid isomerase-like protein
MHSDDIETLEQLNRNYIRSVQEADVRWFDDNLTPDFLNSNPDGSLVDRAGFLAQIARPVTITGLQAEDVRIRTFGDTAIIHARTTYRKADGQQGTGRYTDIWHRKGARWLCVAAHVTRG